jgi:hypothetical protein
MLPSSRANAQQQAPMRAGDLAPPPPMQSGGLTPPGGGPQPQPMYPQQPGYPNQAGYSHNTPRELEHAAQSDSGRGLEFVYFDVGGGGQFVSLDALSSSGSLLADPSAKTSAFGPYFAAGAGIRLLFLTIGPRFRYATFSDFKLWSIGLEVGWHIPLGNLEPYGFLGGGFTKLNGENEVLRDVAPGGFDIRLGGGVDYYLSSVFSIGGTLQVEMLRLARDGVKNPTSTIMGEASSLGLAVNFGAVAGLHF